VGDRPTPEETVLLPEDSLAPGYFAARLRGALRPPVTVTPPPSGVIFERDLPVRMPDGVVLRVNVFRPEGGRPCPVVMCAHPYGKDAFPRPWRGGYLPSVQYRMMRQPAPVRYSAWTTWEAPDPAFWVPRGYAVVNADLRGYGRSEGVGNVLTAAEGHDYHALIEWAGTQPWSTGKVGLNGVSYLAISQWRGAETRPPHLAALCAWEGWCDVYRDFARPGGIRETGFFPFWTRSLRSGDNYPIDLCAEQAARPLRDAFWDSLAPDVSRIEVPALVCGSFSDHELHTSGSFDAFGRLGSREKWLYTHGGGKWATYYSQEALAFQARFFDCFLKGEDNGMREVPPVRLEIRDSASEIHAVRGERAWPIPGTRWTKLHLHGDGSLREASAAVTARRTYDAPAGRASFSWRADKEVELAGPMKLRLHLSLEGADDTCIFVGLRKTDAAGREVFFEGSYGFGCDMLSHGWLKLSRRELDEARSEPFRPVLTHRTVRSISPGEVVPVEIAILPAATRLRRGEGLRLDVQGRWFHATNPLMGGSAGYEASQSGTVVIHAGGDHDAHLLVPFLG
jgi:uncharacterized protein